jgi:CubicO group peptidase (beta-lactamase class C family)
MLRSRAAWMVVALLGAWQFGLVDAYGQPCPETTWERIEAKAGWSVKRLRAADDIARANGTTSYLVAHGGKLVWEYGETSVPAPLYSVRKSIASILYGIASDRGKVELDRTLAQLGIDDVDGLSATEKSATIRHLLSARSCIYHKAAYAHDQESRRPERDTCKPGEQFLYYNWGFNALGTIYQQLTSRSLFDAFEAELAGPLQLEHFRKKAHTRFHRESVSVHPAYLFQLSARDMARIGLLMARNGDWCGKRIVSARWVRESTAAISEASPGTGYGYLWWVGDTGKLFRGQFNGHVFSARGQGGQYIVVNPSDDLVIVHTVKRGPVGDRAHHRKFTNLLQAITNAHR